MSRDFGPESQAYQQTPFGLADAYAELQNLLLDSPDVGEFLHHVAGVAAGLVADASCGITMRRHDQVRTVASSDGFALRLDEDQYHGGKGPCLHTLRTGEETEITDLAADLRWPDYRVRALADGVGSSYSVPLVVNNAVAGAVNLYSRIPHGFTRADCQHIRAFTRQAAVALTLLSRHLQHVTIDSELQEALATRTIIDQALGIIMGQQRASATDAFALLREISQHSNRKLVDVAAELITTVAGRPPQSPRPFVRRT